MRTAKFALTAAAAAAFSFAGASDALAQACIGTPTISGERAVAVGAGFPAEATSYHARMDLNMSGPLSVYGAYTHTATPQGRANTNGVGVGAAYHLLTPIEVGQVQISACPAVGLQYGLARDGNVEQHHMVVPIGVGLGARVDMGAGIALTPYVLPEFYLERVSTTAAGQTSALDNTGLRTTVGTAVDFGPFFVGADYTTHFRADLRERQVEVPFLHQGMNPQLGVRVGVKF